MRYLNLTDLAKANNGSLLPREQMMDETIEPHLESLAFCPSRLSSPEILTEMLDEFAEKLVENADHLQVQQEEEAEPVLSIEMPVNLLLMTPHFEFNLFDMPADFKGLQRQYYK